MDHDLLDVKIEKNDIAEIVTFSIQCVANESLVGDYIRHNPHLFDKTMLIVSANNKLIPYLDEWMIFHVVEKGHLGHDVLLGKPIIRIRDDDQIVLNWPELRAQRPDLSIVYSATLDYTDAKLTQLRVLPGFGDKVSQAISRDNAEELANVMRNDPDCIDTEIDSQLPLVTAIKWNASNCFSYMLKNNWDRFGALEHSIRYGRLEMMAILSQTEQFDAGCAQAAVFGYRNNILQLLFKHEYCDNPGATLRQTAIMHNPTAQHFLLGLMTVNSGPIVNFQAELVAWFQAHKGEFNPWSMQLIAEHQIPAVVAVFDTIADAYVLMFVEGCLKRETFVSTLVDPYLPTISALPEDEKVDISCSHTPQALAYCLTNLPSERMRIKEATPIILTAIRHDQINLVEIEWFQAAESLCGITGLFNATVNLSMVNTSGENVLHHLMKYPNFIEAKKFAKAMGVSSRFESNYGVTPKQMKIRHSEHNIDVFPIE